MKIQKRGTDVKGHTTHYLVGSKWRTRQETVSLAEAGKIPGVVVCSGEYGKYVQSIPSADVRLYDLDEKRMS